MHKKVQTLMIEGRPENPESHPKELPKRKGLLNNDLNGSNLSQEGNKKEINFVRPIKFPLLLQSDQQPVKRQVPNRDFNQFFASQATPINKPKLQDDSITLIPNPIQGYSIPNNKINTKVRGDFINNDPNHNSNSQLTYSVNPRPSRPIRRLPPLLKQPNHHNDPNHPNNSLLLNQTPPPLIIPPIKHSISMQKYSKEKELRNKREEKYKRRIAIEKQKKFQKLQDQKKQQMQQEQQLKQLTLVKKEHDLNVKIQQKELELRSKEEREIKELKALKKLKEDELKKYKKIKKKEISEIQDINEKKIKEARFQKEKSKRESEILEHKRNLIFKQRKQEEEELKHNFEKLIKGKQKKKSLENEDEENNNDEQIDFFNLIPVKHSHNKKKKNSKWIELPELGLNEGRKGDNSLKKKNSIQELPLKNIEDVPNEEIRDDLSNFPGLEQVTHVNRDLNSLILGREKT